MPALVSPLRFVARIACPFPGQNVCEKWATAGKIKTAIAGILEFIPVVGPAVAAVVIVSISFLGNYPHLLIVVLFLGIWRVLQDYVISPRVMGANLEMHPLAAIFAVLVGAELWGVVGVYLSIPIMASLRILWRSWHRYAEMQAQMQAKTQLQTRRPAA